MLDEFEWVRTVDQIVEYVPLAAWESFCDISAGSAYGMIGVINACGEQQSQNSVTDCRSGPGYSLVV
ncbi:hypothetical protein D3C81_365650 [compost metagenome]